MNSHMNSNKENQYLSFNLIVITTPNWFVGIGSKFDCYTVS